MTREELVIRYSNLVYWVYYNKFNGYMRKKYADQWEDAIHEGVIGLMKAIDRWAELGKPYDTPGFRGTAFKYIYWEMCKFYSFGTTIFKLTSRSFDEKNIDATNMLRNRSVSLDKTITDENAGADLYNFYGMTWDTYDGIFYDELEKFLQLIPENEREIMRCYYYCNIEMYEDPDLAIAVVAKQLSISTWEIRNIAKKWNDELYAYLHSEKEQLEDIHERFESEREQDETEQYQKRKKRGTLVRIVKDGAILHVLKHMVDKYIKEGWVEAAVANGGANKVPAKYSVNNGKVILRVFEDEIQKFLDIGFVRGLGKGIPKNTGKKSLCIMNPEQ